MNPTPSDLRKLLAGATPGPLFIAEGGICSTVCPENGANVICCEPERVMKASLAAWPANAALIVAAVNALPEHLAEIDALRARAEAAEARVEGLREALVRRDAKAAKCPDKKLVADRDCPVCGASSDEGCRVTALADAGFAHNARAALQQGDLA